LGAVGRLLQCTQAVNCRARKDVLGAVGQPLQCTQAVNCRAWKDVLGAVGQPLQCTQAANYRAWKDVLGAVNCRAREGIFRRCRLATTVHASCQLQGTQGWHLHARNWADAASMCVCVAVSRFLKFTILKKDLSNRRAPHQPAGPCALLPHARWVYESGGAVWEVPGTPPR